MTLTATRPASANTAAAQAVARRAMIDSQLRVSGVNEEWVLAAMARDDGPSRVSVVAARLGVSPNYANQYRQRLLGAQLVRPAGRGLLDFAVPYLREHLRETHPGG